jgi:phage shock protein A
MGIFSKLKTFIVSKINALIGKAEKPEKMLDQLVVEMNEQLTESKKAIAMAIADEKKLEREKAEKLVQAKEWERKATLAVAAGRDELAKEALLRKQEYDNAANECQKQWEAQKNSIDHLKESLKELQARIKETQRKKNLLIVRAKRAEAQQKIQNIISGVPGYLNIFDAFDRMAAKIDETEALPEK